MEGDNLQKTIRVQIENGVHARTAALISGVAANISREFNAEVFIRKDMTSVPATSMLALNYLKIKNQDEIELIIEGGLASDAMKVMEKLFVSDDNLKITDLESFDKVLEANSIRSELILDQMANGVLYLNKEGIIVLINEAAEKILGRSRLDMLGSKLEHCFDSNMLKVFEGSESFEGRRIHAFGKHLECSMKSTKIDSGKGVIVTLRDVSTLVGLNNELSDVKAVRERLGLLLDQMTDSIIIVDNNALIQYMNKRAMSLLGLTLSDIGSKLDAQKFPQVMTALEKQAFFLRTELFNLIKEKKSH